MDFAENGGAATRYLDLSSLPASPASSSDAKDGAGCGRAEVHWLPCHIDHDGPASVEAYFRGSMRAAGEGGEAKEAYVRGRHLKGADLPLPEGYCAAVLERGGTAERPAWKAASDVPTITYWNHTTNPGETDAPRRALEFLDIADAVM